MFSFLNRQTHTISIAGWILSVAALVSAILGLVRTRLLLDLYGVSIETDIYNIAFRIPDLIYTLIIGGAISAAFIPVFISHWNKSKKEAWTIADSFLKVSFLAVLILAGALAVLMPTIIDLLFSSFSPEEKKLSVELSRIMLLSPMILGVSAVFSNILQSMNRFIFYAFSPLFYNIGLIIGVVVFTKWWGIYGLAWGVVFGALLHLAIQIPGVLQSGFSFSKSTYIHPAIFRIIKLMAPRSFALGIYQINTIAITALAATISSGAITIFVNANNIDLLLTGIFGLSFATAVFPTLSHFYSKKDYTKYIDSFSHVLRGVFFITFPIGLLLFVLRYNATQLIYGVDNVLPSDIQLMAATLGILSFGAFAYALAPIITRAFYAKENTKTPVIASVINMLTTVSVSSLLLFVVFPNTNTMSFFENILNLQGIENTEVIALPMAVTLAGLVSLLVVFVSFLISDKRNFVIMHDIWSAILRIGFASLLSTVMAWGTLRLINIHFDHYSPSALLLESIIVSTVALITYLAMVYIMRFPEKEVITLLLKRRRK